MLVQVLVQIPSLEKNGIRLRLRINFHDPALRDTLKIGAPALIVDNNNLQLDGSLDQINTPKPIDEKFKAFKFHVIDVSDGHDFEQLAAAFAEARTVKGQPTVIIAHTVKGKGVSFMENQVGWHGKAPNQEQYEQAMKELEGEVA